MLVKKYSRLRKKSITFEKRLKMFSEHSRKKCCTSFLRFYGWDPLASPPASLEVSLLPFSRFPDSDGVEVPVFAADISSGTDEEAVVAEDVGTALTLVLLAPGKYN